MTLTKKILLVLAVLAVLVGTGAVVSGGTVARTLAPEIFVIRMAEELQSDFLPALEPLEFADALLDGEYTASFSVGLAALRGEDTTITPEMISAAQLMRLHSTVTFIDEPDALESETTLQMAVSPVVSLQTRFERDLLSVRVPQLFDYHISLDPSRVSHEWNNSVFGGLLGAAPLDDALFYAFYSDMFALFSEEFWEEFFDELDENFRSEVEYLGRGDDNTHVYRLTSPLNAIVVDLHEENGRFSHMSFSGKMRTERFSGHLYSLGDSRYDFTVIIENVLSTITIEGTSSGALISNSATARVAIEAPADDFEAVLDVQFNLHPSVHRAELFDRAAARHISEIDIADVIAIAARLQELPFMDMLA